jgi:ribonucleoside-diphosphate reductase beta chain
MSNEARQKTKMDETNITEKRTIFDEQHSRKPLQYKWAKDFIMVMWKNPWNPEDFSFKSDIHDFKTKLSSKEKQILVRSLSMIAQVETRVKLMWARVGDNLKRPELRDLGSVMANVETVHNLAYEKLLDVLGLEDEIEKNMQLDIIKGRDTYLTKHCHKFYTDSKKQYIYSLILFTLFVENVSLFSQFYIINWFNNYENVIKDTAQQVAYTAKEENIHALVGITIINEIRKELPELFDDELKEKILREAKKAVEYENQIIDWIIGDYNKPKINALILKEFIKNRMNESLSQIGYPTLFDVDSTLLRETRWFNEEVIGTTSTDFFHQKPVEYSRVTIDEDDLF